jgi:radical SAM superfamily enzyme YgiQ (UPF0313 family)
MPEQMLDTIALMEDLAQMGARIHAHSFMPLPGSPWAALAPAPISTVARRHLESLISRGKLFGQWKRQEQLIQQMETLKETPLSRFRK